jgi:hypothetical protein
VVLSQHEELDLSEITRSVPSMQPSPVQHGLQLTEDGRAYTTISGDQARLTQLLINLVDDALRCRASGGAVCVSVSHDLDWAVLWCRTQRAVLQSSTCRRCSSAVAARTEHAHEPTADAVSECTVRLPLVIRVRRGRVPVAFRVDLSRGLA